jgi:hypothetical protein
VGVRLSKVLAKRGSVTHAAPAFRGDKNEYAIPRGITSRAARTNLAETPANRHKVRGAGHVLSSRQAQTSAEPEDMSEDHHALKIKGDGVI